MAERSISVQELLELLPEGAEFDVLRQVLLRVSVPDPQERWSSAAAYATLDRRAIPVSMIGQILNEAEGAGRRRLKRIFDAVTLAFSSVVDAGASDQIRQLIATGEASETAEQWQDAVLYYRLSEALARRRADRNVHALTLRRLGRTYMHCGEYERATRRYAESYTQASAIEDPEGQIIAAMGMANVARLQGRWQNSEYWDLQAYNRCSSGFDRQRAQLCVNLSITARERGLDDEADRWLQQAHEYWGILTTAERTAWWANYGLVRLARGELPEAETSFERALAEAGSHFHRAMILDNMAELALRQQRYELAVARCRQAEEHALALGTPRVLAEVYMRLGRVCRFREDPNGVAFFEKAVELGSNGTFPLLFGNILFEYAKFRKRMEDPLAARELFLRAQEIFSQLGATTRLDEVQAELA